MTARDVFDDYMIYVEWNREAEKKFWLPRRKILLPVVDSIQSLIDDELDLLTISLPPGSGKSTIKKLCDGLNITIPEFFSRELFENLEQEIE